MKQNMRFQGRIRPEKVPLDQIQNGRLPAITCIDFNMHDIWKTVRDS